MCNDEILLPFVSSCGPKEKEFINQIFIYFDADSYGASWKKKPSTLADRFLFVLVAQKERWNLLGKLRLVAHNKWFSDYNAADDLLVQSSDALVLASTSAGTRVEHSARTSPMAHIDQNKYPFVSAFRQIFIINYELECGSIGQIPGRDTNLMSFLSDTKEINLIE